MGDVVDFSGETLGDLDPKAVLQAALDDGITDVVVLGLDSDGLMYFASASGNAANVYWMLSIARDQLMEMSREGHGG